MNVGSTHARLRDRLREETSRAILEAAEAVFAEDGLHAARMERIASRAGLAVGTLYNHFEDKGALIRCLVRSRRGALLARVDAAVEAAPRRSAARVRAFLGAVAEHARAHGGFLAALVQAGEGPGRARPPRSLHAELAARADRIVAQGVAAGELRPDPAKVFGLALVGMARAVLMRAIDEPGDAAIEAVVDLFLEGAGR